MRNDEGATPIDGNRKLNNPIPPRKNSNPNSNLNNLNNNSLCLQALSIYNLSSPVFSLLIPVLFLLLPFFIIKLQGHKITFGLYFDHLKNVFSNHIIGQLFSSFSNTNFTNKIYLLFSFGFYIFQMYLNFTSCIKYFTNIKYIHETLYDLKDYIVTSLNKYKNFLKYSRDLVNYKHFNDTINIEVNGFYSMNYLAYYALRIGGFLAWNKHRKVNAKMKVK